MDSEISAAVHLLFNILSKRGEKVKETEIRQLALWAWEKGKLRDSSLLFSASEWREIGELLWDASLSGGKEAKIAHDLGAVWKKVSQTLRAMLAEKKAAAAALQAFQGVGDEKTEPLSPPPPSKPDRPARIFGLEDLPIRGLSASVSPTPRDVLEHVMQTEQCSPRQPEHTEDEQEVVPQLHLGGVVKGGDSGGAEGGDGQVQMTPHKGGSTGGTTGGDESDVSVEAVCSSLLDAPAQMSAERRNCSPRRSSAAPRLAPPAGDIASCAAPAAAGHLATAAETAQAAGAGARASTLPCTRKPAASSTPTDSDSDSNENVTAFASLTKQCAQNQSQPVPVLLPSQRSSELHQIVSKLAQLLHYPEEQHSSSQLPVLSTNPIDERKAAAAKTALLAGDWDAANALSCPVMMMDGTARWKPFDYKLLQKAKDTVTTYGLRSEAARNIIRYIFTADLLCPSDCSSVASLLLTPSQLLIFEREWKRLAAEEASKHHQVGDPLYTVQPDTLTGNGAYASSSVQLTFPVEMHQLAQSLALQALLLVPDKKKSSPYCTIKQGNNESYAQFIDRLSSALKDATDLPPDVREHLFRSLAFENANSRARAILATLPKESPVDEMLVRATRAEHDDQKAAFMATMHDAIKQQGHIVAAALNRACSSAENSSDEENECESGDPPGTSSGDPEIDDPETDDPETDQDWF